MNIEVERGAMKNQIIPLFIGNYKKPYDKSGLVYRYPAGESYIMPNGFFAIRQESGKIVMVDAGMPDPKKITEYGYAPLEEGAKSFDQVMKEAEIDPLAVETVIVTHLHWDHSWNLDKLPNASVYVQRKEIYHAVTPYKPERTSFGFVAGKTNPPWLKAIDRVVPLDGDEEILPGIRIMLTPGHTHGGQSVLVDTVEGTYALVGDFYLIPESFELELPPALHVTTRGFYEGLKKLKKADLTGVLGTHDMKTYERKIWG